jgi:hypothetical protein
VPRPDSSGPLRRPRRNVHMGADTAG